MVNIYRSPSSNFNIFLSKTNELLEIIHNSKREPLIIITGDFNCNLLNDSVEKRDFMSLLLTFNLITVINDVPTRVTCDSASLIDNIITNADVSCVEATVLVVIFLIITQLLRLSL
jgi:hypothetical protein